MEGSHRAFLRVLHCASLNSTQGTGRTTMSAVPFLRGPRLRLKCDGTRAETRFRLSAKRTSPFKSAETSVQSTTGSRGVRISGTNAGYTMFRGRVKSTGYPLHSPVSPSLTLPYVTVFHRISTGLYSRWGDLSPASYRESSRAIQGESVWNFGVEKVTAGHGLLRVLRFHPASCIPPILHIHQFIYHRCYMILVTNNVFSNTRKDNAFTPISCCSTGDWLSLKPFVRIDSRYSEGRTGWEWVAEPRRLHSVYRDNFLFTNFFV